MRRESIAGLLAGLGIACGSSGAFPCSANEQCGAGGRCEAQGFCSFPDDACPSGQRFGEHAGDGLQGECTDPPAASTGLEPMVTMTGDGDSTRGDPDPSTTGDPGGVSTGIVDECPEGWWDCDWLYRRELTIAGDPLDEALVDFPVPITLPDIDDPRRFGDGTDLRVVDASGAPLAFELDTWVRGDRALLWVRVPSIASGDDTRLWLYYGNPGAEPGDAGSSAWSADFAAVWHLDAQLDATANANDAVDEGSMPAPGVFGMGRAFDGLDGRLVVSSSPSIEDLPSDGFTITAWISPLSAGETSGGRLVDKANSLSASAGWTVLLFASAAPIPLQLDRGSPAGESRYRSVGALAVDQWQFVAVRFMDGEEAELMVDDALLRIGFIDPAPGEGGSDVGLPLAIGGAPYDDVHTFDGTIDELRISRGFRSDTWLRAEYLAGAGELTTLGEEEARPD